MTFSSRIYSAILLSISLTFLSSCYRHDVRSYEIDVENVNSREEFNHLKAQILRINQLGMPGQDAKMYDEMTINDELNVITIRYNARLHSKKNIEHSIAKLGYTANGVPGDTNALARTRAQIKR